MAVDPTRRAGTTTAGLPAISVSISWLQERLNALLAGSAPPLVVDGVWGTNTQGALRQFVVVVLGAAATDPRYAVLGVDPAAGRMLLAPALEDELGSVIGSPRVILPGPPAAGGGGGGGSGGGFAIGLTVLATMGIYFATRSRSGGVRGLKGFRLPGFKRPPRAGTRVVFDPNPASMALYSTHPRIGEGGTVKPVSMGRGSSHFMRGPGGGLVYVDWDESRFQGVSLHDLSRAS